MDLIQYFAQQYHHRSEDQLVIQLLGIRLFNGAATAVNNMLSGYYQSSVMIQRDLLEVSFLLDYLKSNPKLITEWRACSESERNKKFGALRYASFSTIAMASRSENARALQAVVQSWRPRKLSGLSVAPAGPWRRRPLWPVLCRNGSRGRRWRIGEDRRVSRRQLYDVFLSRLYSGPRSKAALHGKAVVVVRPVCRQGF